MHRRKKKDYDSVKDYVPEGSSAKDHGAVSWTHVRHLLENMKRDKPFIKGMDEALCAIFKHSSTFEINAEKEPLAFLLLLCDKLQEWGRPRVEVANLTRTIAAAMHYSGLARLNLRKSVTHLEINVTVDACNRQLVPKGTHLNFTLNYENARGTTLEPAVIWAELSFDFKRVCFPCTMSPISIKCVHPFSPGDDTAKWQPTDFELMQEFVLDDTAEGTCLSGWIESIKDGIHGVSYSHEEQKEKFKIELQKLKSLDTLTKLPSGFYKTYSDWKKRF